MAFQHVQVVAAIRLQAAVVCVMASHTFRECKRAAMIFDKSLHRAIQRMRFVESRQSTRTSAAVTLQGSVRRSLALRTAQKRKSMCERQQAVLRRSINFNIWRKKLSASACLQARLRRVLTPYHMDLRAACRASAEARYWRDEGIMLQIGTVSKLSLLTGQDGIGYDLERLLDTLNAARVQGNLLEDLQGALQELQDTVRSEICKDTGMVDLEQILLARDEARYIG
jgi:hypothetical protein